jgi:hypothetical protein
VARFNANLCFQLPRSDTLQNPLRKSYQSAARSDAVGDQGPYPIFDNVTAIFSATPSSPDATYLYACTEWVEDAFGARAAARDLLATAEPTSISLPITSST